MIRLLPLALAFAAGTLAAHLLAPRRESAPAATSEDDDVPTTQRVDAPLPTDDDRRLAAAVRAGLERRGLADSIDIQAEEGRIVATGEVADARHADALQAIRAVPGVREVHDHLQPLDPGAAAGERQRASAPSSPGAGA